MKETGLMFKATLVRAILSGQKTQTRRILKFRPGFDIEQRDDGRLWQWVCRIRGRFWGGVRLACVNY